MSIAMLLVKCEVHLLFVSIIVLGNLDFTVILQRWLFSAWLAGSTPVICTKKMKTEEAEDAF